MLRSLFTRDDVEVRAITGQASLWGDWPGTDSMSRTWAGTTVDAHASLQLLTVYGCVRLISDSISTLPIDCYRQTGDIKTDIPTPQWLLQPTVDLDFTSWCGQVLSSLLLSGNAYLAVLRSEAGTILELVPLDPAKVQVRREQGRKVYFIDGSRYAGEMVHIPGLMLPGSDVGMSPVEYARQSIGLGLAATQYGAAWFDGEGNMPGVIEAPRALQPETMKAMAEHWRRRRNRANRGLPGVLQEGATWKPTGVTNEQMQFLQTRQYTAAEIAGQMFLVDPSDLGIGVAGSSLTYANLADRNTRRVQVTLLPWITRIEHAVSSLMLRPRYMKFNVNALLRADLAARYSSYATGIGAGFLLPDEARELEDLPPLDQPDVGVGVQAERAGMQPIERQVIREMPDVHLHLPERHEIAYRQDAPVVHVAAPIVNVPPAEVVVNVPPADVVVNVPPAEVVVNVAPAEVSVSAPVTVVPAEVTVLPANDDVDISLIRDGSGRIVGARKSSP